MSAWRRVQHIEAPSAQANIEFTSIPSSYTDLLVVFSLRSSRAAENDAVFVRINDDAANHSHRFVRGSGSGVGTGSDLNVGFFYAVQGVGNTSTGSTFSNGMIYIPNYTGSQNKVASLDGVGENAATGAWQVLDSGLYASSNPVTSIRLYPEIGPTWMQYSSATLYGITKGSSGGVTVS
jgi:hypothetical protein